MNGYCNNSAIVWNIIVLCYQNDYQMHDSARLEFWSLTRDFKQHNLDCIMHVTH